MTNISLEDCPLKNTRFQVNLNSFTLSIRMVDYYRFDYSRISNEYHFHDCYELVFVLDGRGTFRTEERDYLLHEGGLFISAPEESHEIHVSQGETMTLLYLMFKIDQWNRNPAILSREEEIITHFLDTRKICTDREIKLRSYISFFESYVASGGDRHDEWFRKSLKSFIFQSLQLLSEKKVSHEEKAVIEESLLEKALDYIDTNLPIKITADDVANSVNTSRRNLYRLFKSRLNRPVHDYIKEKKTSLAESYLQMNYSVSETAALVGMENLSQFSKTFKKYKHISPMEYKRRYCGRSLSYGRRYQTSTGTSSAVSRSILSDSALIPIDPESPVPSEKKDTARFRE